MDLRNLSVLVLDDNANTRTLIAEVLRGLGVTRIHRAATCAEGLAILKTNAVDILLADIEMDGEDGLGFARCVRASSDPKISSLGIIVVSSHATEARVMEAGALGANSFLSKPFTVAGFARRLTDALVGRRMALEPPKADAPLQIEV
jgi:CheY-like chemotaxis protein